MQLSRNKPDTRFQPRMTRQTALYVAIFLAFAHLVLANLYASATPYRTAGVLFGQRGPDGQPIRVVDVGAPDERQHVNYVARIYRGEPFPFLDPKDPGLSENYESHQPPAYYFLAANWMRLAGSHAPDLSLPADGAWLRALTSLFGAATVLGVFFLGLWGFGKPEVALVAAGIASLLPMNVALSGAASNDPLLFALCTWVLAILVKCINTGWTWKRCVWIGVLTGIALLTKTTAIALLPVLLLAILLKQPARPKPAMISATAVIVLALALPWMLRNQAHYGDPFAMSVFKESFGGTAQAKDMIAFFGAQEYWVKMVWWWTARSFLGVFGYMDIFWASGVYVALILLLVALALGYFFSLRHMEPDEPRAPHVVNAAFIAFVLLMFLAFNAQYFQGQARYLFPAIGPICLLFAAGLLYFFKGAWKPAAAGLLLVLLGLNVYTLSMLPSQFSRRTGQPVSMGRENRDRSPLTMRYIVSVRT